jgi:colanic acid/amylovoran biosynthesis glycosyltransferase
MPNEPSKRVLIFRSELLAISETFVLAQAKALTKFKPRFVGLRRISPSLQVPEDAIVAAQGDGLRHECRGRLYKQFGVATEFHRKVREADAHLIHAHFAMDGVLALPLAEKLDIPLVVTLHGYDVTISERELSQSWTGRLYLGRRKRMWEQATAFLCVSDFIKASAIKAGFPRAKLCTHYIGVDRSGFRRTGVLSLPESVLFVGRLVEKKGCDSLIQAMESVQRQLPHAMLTVVGDGPMRRSLVDLASTRGVQCNFLGSQSSDQIKVLLQQATIVCVPSRTARNGDSEGLPIFLLEAQSMCVPVVGTLHAGIPEAVIHGETGLLGPEGDSDVLAKNLLLLLLNPELRSKYGSRGAQRMATTFEIANQTRKLEDIYDEILVGTANLVT